MPGFSPSDINVEIEDKMLTISGSHKKESEGTEAKVWHSERPRLSHFSRSFTLPDHVKIEDVSAQLVSESYKMTLEVICFSFPCSVFV